MIDAKLTSSQRNSMDTRKAHDEIVGKRYEGRRTLVCRGHRLENNEPVVLKMNATAFGAWLLLMLLLFCVCSTARALQAGPAGTTSVAGAPRVPASSNDKTSLTQEERQWLSQHDGQVRIGITVIPPQVLRGEGKYEGLAIDYIHLVERKLGRRFELVPYATWNDVIQAARERRIDMIFAAQQTPERLRYLLFTEPYLELPNMIVVRKDRQGGSSLKEMRGWSVAASEGSAVHEYLKKEFDYLDLRPVHDELSGLMKVSMGEVDAMVVEISRASYYIEKAGILNLRVAGNAGLLYQLRFAIRNDWPVLRGILDKGLSSITDEERRDISRRWIIVGDRSVYFGRAFWISLVAGLGVIVLTVLGAIGWNRSLQRTVKRRTAQLQQELAERKRAEEALHRLNRELRAISNCNQVLVRAEDEQALLNNICRIICNEAGYRMAWVGYAENDDAKTVRPVAWAGVEDEYLEYAGITWADTERGYGPSGTALRNGQSACIQDFMTDPQAAQWRDSALQRGYRSSIALPLKDESKNTFGVLNIYSTEPNAFTTDEIRLLEELSDDLAFGIAVQRARTERKRSEEAQQESEQRYRDIFDNVLDGLYLLAVTEDGRFRTLEVNPALERMTEIPRSLSVGKTQEEIVPEEAARIVNSKYRRCVEAGRPVEEEVELDLPSGRRYFHSTLIPARDASGRINRIVGISRDISERKRAEEEIRRLNEELEKRVAERTQALQKKSGELNESQNALMNIVEDLNEKTVELERANTKLQELDRLKSMFIASMSHELRTPLNSIIGFSSIMLNGWTGPLTAEQNDNIAAVLRSGKHLLSLINDVIDVSKIEAGKIESLVEEFDVRDVVMEAVEALKKDIVEKGLELKVNAPRQLLHADRRRLLQCLLNLVSNAAKYTMQGSISVSAELSTDGSIMTMVVEDTGIGIREDELGRLFSPFVRLHTNIGTVIPGTGLGLYLTKKLVQEILKGDILVSSTHGSGSRFTLSVPVAG